MIVNFIVRPDAPEPPKADRITKDSVTLSWRPPRSDGGAKIRGYIIQKKAKDDADWSDVNGAPIPSNVYTVPKLKEGEEYLFRVFAVNDVGSSNPSRPSNPIVIEEQPNKPVMDLSGVRDITVRAGEDFSIHVPYIGFPKPTASWFANDVIKDETDPRVHQQLADDFARYIYFLNYYKLTTRNKKKNTIFKVQISMSNAIYFSSFSDN